MGCVPTLTYAPVFRFWALTSWLPGVQLSEALRLASKSGTTAWQLASAEAVVEAGQTSTGAVLSTTVKVAAHELTFPDASVTVTLMGCVPTPTKEPAGGFWLLTSWLAGVQLSEALRLASKSGTAAWQFASAGAVVE